MTIGTLFTLFVTPAVYTFIARDHQKRRVLETLAEAEAAAEAGVLFPASAEPAPAEPVPLESQHSPEAHGSASAASSGQGHERRAAKRRGRRRRYPPAAE
jgi:hypothetical protein